MNDYFWQIQSATSFCKAKGDWLAFGRIHLSFVQHEGKPHCKQTAAIEGAIKLHGADGALYLSDMILSGTVKKKAEKSRAEANGGFAAPIFTSMGGTAASRSKDGTATFRQFSLAPGSRSDYVFSMMTCAGEMNTIGGIQPLKGAQRTTIYVPLSSGDLVDFARSVQTEYGAYRTHCLTKGEKPAIVKEGGEEKPSDENAGTKASPDEIFCIAYDSDCLINGGFPLIAPVSRGAEMIREMVRILMKERLRFKADTEAARAVIKSLQNGECGSYTVPFTSEADAKQECCIVVVVSKLWNTH